MEQGLIAKREMKQPPDNTSRSVYAFGGVALVGIAVVVLFTLYNASERQTRAHANVAAAAAHEVPFGFAGSAKSVYVYDVSAKRVLYEHSADAQLPLASITKVPLVLSVAEVLEPYDQVIVSREAVMRGEGGGLGTGDTWRVRDLIDFTLAASSNAGAEVLAEAADGKLRQKYPQIPRGVSAAVWRMNDLARELGLTSTYFLNPSGLDVSANQAASMSTAKEVATLMVYAAEHAPELFSGTTQWSQTLGPLNGSEKPLHNTNDALPDIPGLIIGKTGFTDLAGGNLAVIFEIEPEHRIVAVIMGSTYDGRFEDMRTIVEAVRKSAFDF